MKILIVSHFITPLLSVASIRWTKIVKYLKKQYGDELEIHVLTDEKNYDGSYKDLPVYEKDFLLEKDLIYFDKYISIKPAKSTLLLYKARNVLKRLRKQCNTHIHNSIFADNQPQQHGWSLMHEIRCLILLHETKVFLRRIDIKDYDVIISSSGPMWVHKIASIMKNKCKDAIWLADYRDACFYEREPVYLKKWHKYQSHAYTRNADAIICVSDTIPIDTDDCIKKFVVSNGYDPEEKRTGKKSTTFSIAYTGTLNDNDTDFSILFKAIKELIEEGKIEENKLKVVYAGRQKNIADKYAEAANARDLLDNKGELSREESLELQYSSSILLQSSFNSETFHMFWTGKMFEYMMSGKPILYIVNGCVPYSLPSRYIHKLGGYCYESARRDETYGGMKNFIERKYLEWRQNGITYASQDANYIEEYSYLNIAKKIKKIIDEIKTLKMSMSGS